MSSFTGVISAVTPSHPQQQDLFNRANSESGVHLSAQAESDAVRPDIVFQRSSRALNYRLTLRRDGVAVATIPARGSEREARRFVEQHRQWLERARSRQRLRPRAASTWPVGAHVLWRGEHQEIRKASEGPRPTVSLGADVFRVPGFGN